MSELRLCLAAILDRPDRAEWFVITRLKEPVAVLLSPVKEFGAGRWPTADRTRTCPDNLLAHGAYLSTQGPKGRITKDL